MQLPFYVARPDVVVAQKLISEYGAAARAIAADRASASRSNDNYLHYCRWRQIERLVTLLTTGAVIGRLQ